MASELSKWIERNSASDRVWFLKRLSANDVGATGGHQVGLYIPKELAFAIFPSIASSAPTANLDSFFTLDIASHDQSAEARVIWYNNKYWQHPVAAHPRDETRITRFGGRTSPFQNHDNMGAIAILAFPRARAGLQSDEATSAWVCRNPDEEGLVEDVVGSVEPGTSVIWEPGGRLDFAVAKSSTSCWLERDELPAAWREAYPTGEQIVAKTLELRPMLDADVDRRLLGRRDCEYQLFQSVEEAIELPRIASGFSSISAFVGHAQTVLQRRKSRSGNSLELHVRAILLESDFVEGRDFVWKPRIEGGKIPDFLFPSAHAYADEAVPANHLRLLAAKTTCKDRWRQVADEANRISTKHLLTLQEGVSVSQFRQMQQAGIQLVVPKGLIAKYPEEIRGELVTLEAFLAELRGLQEAAPEPA